MPIYEYVCEKCQNELEALQKVSDPKLTVCPECGESALKRKTSISAFHLKGGGWYKDGYSVPSSNSEKTDSTPSKPAAEPVNGEKKSAAKPENTPSKTADSKASKTSSVPSSKAS